MDVNGIVMNISLLFFFLYCLKPSRGRALWCYKEFKLKPKKESHGLPLLFTNLGVSIVILGVFGFCFLFHLGES